LAILFLKSAIFGRPLGHHLLFLGFSFSSLPSLHHFIIGFHVDPPFLLAGVSLCIVGVKIVLLGFYISACRQVHNVSTCA
jgi:hypothetical protein